MVLNDSDFSHLHDLETNCSWGRTGLTAGCSDSGVNVYVGYQSLTQYIKLQEKLKRLLDIVSGHQEPGGEVPGTS